MPIEERVLIAGAGPVGLVAAANLVRGGVPVTVFEAGPDLSEESGASTFHPPTLDMLDRLGAARPLIAQGLTALAFQYRSRRHGVLAQFDFGAIADVTAHPYRVQCEQSKLTRILYRQLREKPDFELQFDAHVKDVTQQRSGVEIAIERNGRTEMRSGRWLISADFAQSLMATVVPGVSNYEVAHVTLYKVHQRVAKTFQRGRAFLVGDAAHINNPLGGMGMNGGIHDAINLTSRLIEVWHDGKAEGELERYDRQRRLVTLEYIEKQSIQNKRNLESDGTDFGRSLAEIAADKSRTYEYLLRVSMIASLRRAQELG